MPENCGIVTLNCATFITLPFHCLTSRKSFGNLTAHVCGQIHVAVIEVESRHVSTDRILAYACVDDRRPSPSIPGSWKASARCTRARHRRSADGDCATTADGTSGLDFQRLHSDHFKALNMPDLQYGPMESPSPSLSGAKAWGEVMQRRPYHLPRAAGRL